MNKKGFTMIELLAVIVILGLLLGVGIPAVNKVLANFRLDYYKKLEGTLATAGQEFVSDKRYQKPTELMYSRVITKEELVGGKYIDEILDYKENECAGSYVVVAKIGDKHYEYQACLKCETDEYETDTSNKEYDLCNIAWQDNENIDYGAVNDKEKLWVYYGTPANEIKNELGLSYGISKKDSEGKVLAQAEGMENKIVYPNNINELVSANLDKEVTLRYELPTGESVDRKAEMYRYDSPTVKITYTKDNKATNVSSGTIYTENKWANSLDFELTFTQENQNKYSEIINRNTKLVVEYYDYRTKKWVNGGSCNETGIKKCKITYAKNFVGKVKFRIKDDKGNPSKETRDYTLKVDIDPPVIAILKSCKEMKKTDQLVEYAKECTDLTFETNGNVYTYTNESWDGKFIYVKFNQGSGSNIYLQKGQWNTQSILSNNSSQTWQIESHQDNFGFFDYGQREGSLFLYDEAGNSLKFELRVNVSAEIDVILDKNGGSGGSNTIYEIYGKGFATSLGNNNRVQKDYETLKGTTNTHKFYEEDITYFSNSNKITPPTRTGYIFMGYYTAKTNGTKYINADGSLVNGVNNKIFDENHREIDGRSTARLYARWSRILDFTITNPTNGNWTNSNIVLTFKTQSESAEIEGWYYTYNNSLSASNKSNVGSNGNTQWVKYTGGQGKTTFNSSPFSQERDQDVYIMLCLTDGRCKKKSTRIRIDKTAPYYSTGESRDCDSVYSGYRYCYMPIIRDNLSGVNSRCISTSGGENHCDNYGGIMAVSDELNTTSSSIWWDYSSACDIAGNCGNLGRYYHSW